MSSIYAKPCQTMPYNNTMYKPMVLSKLSWHSMLIDLVIQTFCIKCMTECKRNENPCFIQVLQNDDKTIRRFLIFIIMEKALKIKGLNKILICVLHIRRKRLLKNEWRIEWIHIYQSLDKPLMIVLQIFLFFFSFCEINQTDTPLKRKAKRVESQF